MSGLFCFVRWNRVECNLEMLGKCQEERLSSCGNTGWISGAQNGCEVDFKKGKFVATMLRMLKMLQY